MASERRRGKAQAALAVSSAAATVTGHKYLAAALKRAGAALGRFRDDRVERMWANAMGSVSDPVAFTEKIEAALLRDGDEVAQGFVSAATAAANAVAPSVIPSIGLLARWFLAPRLELASELKPNRRLYRALLLLLQQFDDEEFGAFREAMHTLAGLRSDIDPFSTIVHRDGPDSEWQWYCRNTEPPTVLAIGESAPVIARALLPVLEEPPFGEARTDQRARDRPFLARELVNVLVSIMPVERRG